MRTLTLAMLVLAFAAPAHAATLLCTPIGLAEMIGEPGPLTIPAADPSLGDPIVFWIDTETGDYQEHFPGGNQFITGQGRYQVQAEAGFFSGYNAEQEITLNIDFALDLAPYYMSRDGALSELGTCTPSAMGQL